MVATGFLHPVELRLLCLPEYSEDYANCISDPVCGLVSVVSPYCTLLDEPMVGKA